MLIIIQYSHLTANVLCNYAKYAACHNDINYASEQMIYVKEKPQGKLLKLSWENVPF